MVSRKRLQYRREDEELYTELFSNGRVRSLSIYLLLQLRKTVARTRSMRVATKVGSEKSRRIDDRKMVVGQ